MSTLLRLDCFGHSGHRVELAEVDLVVFRICCRSSEWVRMVLSQALCGQETVVDSSFQA